MFTHSESLCGRSASPDRRPPPDCARRQPNELVVRFFFRHQDVGKPYCFYTIDEAIVKGYDWDDEDKCRCNLEFAIEDGSDTELYNRMRLPKVMPASFFQDPNHELPPNVSSPGTAVAADTASPARTFRGWPCHRPARDPGGGPSRSGKTSGTTRG